MSQEPEASLSSGVASWRGPHWIAGTLALILGLTLGWISRQPEVPTGGDEATYLELSRSIEQGHYRDEFLAGTPPHSQYPPGTPLWLVTLRSVFGPSLEIVRAANLLLIALTALLVGDAVRRLATPWIGIGALAVTVLNPALLEIAGTPLSEALYTEVSVFVLWGALVSSRRPSRRWLLLATAGAVAGFLTRVVGIAVIASFGLGLLLQRRWREAGAYALATGGVVGAWFLYSIRAASLSIGQSYVSDLEGSRQGRSLLQRALNNARQYLTNDLAFELGLPTIPGTPVDNIVWLVLLSVTLLAGLWVLVRRWPQAAATLAFSVAILLVWPFPVDRYLIPLLPLIVAAILLGTQFLGQSLRLAKPNRITGVVAVVLAVSALSAQVVRGSRWAGCHHPNAWEDGSCYNPEDRSMVAAARFIRDNLPADAVIVSSKPPTIFFYSGRRGIPITTLPGSGVPVGQARYVLLTRVRPVERGEAALALNDTCSSYFVRARFPPASLLLEVRDRGTQEDACQAMGEYLRDTTKDSSLEPRP